MPILQGSRKLFWKTFLEVLKKLESRWTKCIELEGNYRKINYISVKKEKNPSYRINGVIKVFTYISDSLAY